MDLYNKIPTAKELLKEEYRKALSGDEYDVAQAMIEFAKFHVKAALKAAAESEELNFKDKYWVDQDSILNAYPDELIK